MLPVALSPPLLVGKLFLYNLDMVFLRQVFQRLVVGHLFVLHHEMDGGTPLTAREALADILRGRHGERGIAVLVKRTQAYVIGSPLAGSRNRIPPHYLAAS